MCSEWVRRKEEARRKAIKHKNPDTGWVKSFDGLKISSLNWVIFNPLSVFAFCFPSHWQTCVILLSLSFIIFFFLPEKFSPLESLGKKCTLKFHGWSLCFLFFSNLISRFFYSMARLVLYIFPFPTKMCKLLSFFWNDDISHFFSSSFPALVP